MNALGSAPKRTGANRQTLVWGAQLSLLPGFLPIQEPKSPKNTVKKHGTCCRPVDGVTPTHTHTHKMCSSQIIGVIMSHFLSCHNFCKIVSLHRVENPLLTVITVTSMIDIWLMNLSKKKSSAPEFVLSFQQCLGSWSGLLKRCSPLSLLLGPYCLLLFQWPRTLPSLTACYFRVRFRYLCLYVLENDVVFIMKGSGGNLARTKLYVFGGFSRCLHQCSYIMKLNMCESWRRLQYTIHEHTPHPKRSPPTHTPPVV